MATSTMGAAVRARPGRTWLLFGVFAGLCVYVLAPVGLPLAVALLVVALAASTRAAGKAAGPAYLCGAGITGLAFTAVLSVTSGTLPVPLLAGFALASVAGVFWFAILRGR